MSHTCISYLQSLAKVSIPLGEFFLARGRSFTAAPLPGGVTLGRAKQCYQNSASAVLYDSDSDWLYVEGFACLPRLFPMQHAWCIDRSGTVIDLTWKHQPGTEYFGIVFNTEALRTIVLETKVWGVFSDFVRPDFIDRFDYIHADYRPILQKSETF